MGNDGKITDVFERVSRHCAAIAGAGHEGKVNRPICQAIGLRAGCSLGGLI
jgi:hypothetical protein